MPRSSSKLLSTVTKRTRVCAQFGGDAGLSEGDDRAPVARGGILTAVPRVQEAL